MSACAVFGRFRIGRMTCESICLMNSTGFYIEFASDSAQVLAGDNGLEVSLERLPGGGLSVACKEKLSARLQNIFRQNPWQPKPRVFCAIGARGVSLRRFSLPAAAREEAARLLGLQIEQEFPLSPDELAWGYRPVGEAQPPRNGSPSQQDYLVAAVRKEVVEELSSLLSACGASPVFALAPLARAYLCPAAPASYALLDLGAHQSELVCVEHGVPVAVRVVAWGAEELTQCLAEALKLPHDEANKFRLKLEQLPSRDLEPAVQPALDRAATSLASALDGSLTAPKLYLTGASARNKEFVSRLERRLQAVGSCEALEPARGAGRSAAVLGLKLAVEKQPADPPLLVQAKPTNGAVLASRPAPWKWVGLAAALVIGFFLLPYVEAMLFKPFLTRKLAALEAERGRLPMSARELAFLQDLKQAQPPYLDTLYILGKSAPQGTKLESLSMNRRGDLAWRATMRTPDQITEFRKKLIDSGLFASVSVEEQSPTPNHQGFAARMSAQWKPAAARQVLAIGPTAEEIEKAKTRDRNSMPGMLPGTPMRGMMPGMPGPMGMPGMEGGAPGRMPGNRRPSNRPGNRPPSPGGSVQVMPGGVVVMPGGMPPGAEGAPMPQDIK